MQYRIDGLVRDRTGARVIALDDSAAAIAARVAREHVGRARFLAVEVPIAPPGDSGSESVALRRLDGSRTMLLDELADADVVVMVATTGGDGTVATIIGAACTVRAVMTAGLIVGDSVVADAAVTALRPHARVLMVTSDEQDVAEVLTALRA